MKTVWITRTQSGAEATAQRVRAAGLSPFIAPLLRVRFENKRPIDFADVAALAFTSANGVRAFAAMTPQRALPVFTVGRGTAAVAKAMGFAPVIAGESDVMDLAAVIAEAVGEGVVLNPGPAEPAADLTDTLEALGVRARGMVVYRTVRARLSEADFEAAEACDFVLLHSAKAARIFRFLKVKRPVPICLSVAVSRALDWKKKVVIASAPSEDALIAVLVEAAR